MPGLDELSLGLQSCSLKELLPHLHSYLADGGRKVGAWQAMMKSAEAHFTDATAFRNINSIAELLEYEEAPR